MLTTTVRSSRARITAGASLTALLTASLILTGLSGPLPASAEPATSSLESVINYLPASEGAFVGSPTLEVLADGSYVAAHNRFGNGASSYGAAGMRFTEVFRSTDKGTTWSKVATVEPLFWATVFELDDGLYLMGIGSQQEHGPAVIYRSTDGGITWSPPTVLLPGTYHTGDTPMLIHEGRIYKTFEQHMGGGWGQYEALVVSAPLGSDLMDAASWTRSNNTDLRFTLEGNPIVAPDGSLYNLLRWHYHQTEAYVTRLTDPSRLELVGPQRFPRGVPVNKFHIIHDEVSGKYLMVGCPETEDKLSGLSHHRNVMALYESDDALNWRFVRVLVADDQGFSWENSVRRTAFSQPTIQLDGDDLLAVSRTAYQGADSNHNTNQLTFHRFPEFRQWLGQGDLVAHYGFDSAETAMQDLSPSGDTHGTSLNGSLAEGRLGQGFSPTVGGMSIENFLHPTLWDTSGLSVAGWITSPATPSSNQVIFQSPINGTTTGLELALSPTGLRAEVRATKGAPAVVRTVPYPDDGQWHHVALSADLAANTMDLYIDGVAVEPDGRAMNFGSTEYKVSVPTVHDRVGSATFGAAFQGVIDEVRVYRTALDAAAVAELAAPTQPRLSGVLVDGTPLAGFNPEVAVLDIPLDGPATITLETEPGTTATPATITTDVPAGGSQTRTVSLDNGTSTRTVTLLLHRDAAPSSRTDLSKILLSGGPASPQLVDGQREYAVTLPALPGQSVGAVQITHAIPRDPRASVQILNQPNTALDSSTGTIRVTAADGTVSDYTITVTVERSADRLAGHWRFDEPQPPYADSSPFGNTGSAAGSSSIPGPRGKALGLPGDVRVVVGSNMDTILKGSTGVTITGWVKRDAAGTGENNWVFGSRINSGSAGIELLFDGADIRMAGRSQISDGYQHRKFAYPDDGEWHHVAGILDFQNKRIRMFVDGVELTPTVTTPPAFGSSSYQSGSATQPDAIGASPANTGRFTGGLDDIAVWGAVLTPAQIADLAADLPDAPPVMATPDPAVPDGDNGWYISPVEIHLALGTGASSDPARIEYRLGGGAWKGYDQPVLIDADGTHTVEYRAVQGYQTGDANGIELRLDRTSPTIAAAAHTHPTTGAKTITLSAGDATSGVDLVQYQLDGAGWGSYLGPLPVSAPGDYVLEYRSIDAAGNTSAIGQLAFDVVRPSPPPATGAGGGSGGGSAGTGGEDAAGQPTPQPTTVPTTKPIEKEDTQETATPAPPRPDAGDETATTESGVPLWLGALLVLLGVGLVGGLGVVLMRRRP